MLWDTHMHSHFSGDSESDPESMVQAAIKNRLDGICFTDHMDLDYPGPTSFTFEPELYFHDLSVLREKYRTQLSILSGIELGLQPHLTAQLEALLKQNRFDFVIGSTHVAHRMDPYYPEFFENRAQHSAYLEYFEVTLENILAFSDFDVYGHLDYVVRYGPTKNTDYTYEMYSEIIDEILLLLIQKGKGIEINMGGYKYGLGHPHPTEAILNRYHELGGEIITLGSDAHAPEHVAFDFHRIKGLLDQTGFSYYSVFKNREPVFCKL